VIGYENVFSELFDLLSDPVVIFTECERPFLFLLFNRIFVEILGDMLLLVSSVL